MPEAELAEVVNSIGPKVRALRDMRGLSLQQLSDRSDVSPAAIHKVEQGNMVPTITTLLKLAAALDRPVSYFVDEEEVSSSHMVVTRSKERKAVYTSHAGIDLQGISGPYGQYFVASAIAGFDIPAKSSSSCSPAPSRSRSTIDRCASTSATRSTSAPTASTAGATRPSDRPRPCGWLSARRERSSVRPGCCERR